MAICVAIVTAIDRLYIGDEQICLRKCYHAYGMFELWMGGEHCLLRIWRHP